MNKKALFAVILVASIVLVLSVITVLAYTVNAPYYGHGGSITTWGGASSIADAIAVPDDGKFVQLAPWSWVSLKFPGHEAAVPDGTSNADLRVDTFDIPFLANAEIFVSLNGSDWTSVGVHADTANIDLDLLEVDGPVKYVKVDQAGHYIDPLHPTLGFDLDAVVALNAGTLPYGEITSPLAGATVSGLVLYEALYWDDDPLFVQWAVREGTCAAATNTVFGNVDSFNDPYTWDGNLFQATADTSSWTPGSYCFVFNPKESSGEGDIRLTQFNVVSSNTPPVAVDDDATTPEDTPVTIDVLANDSDADGDVLVVDSVTVPSNGTVTINGNVTYTPDSDFCGSDSFTYTAGDGNGGSDTADVTVVVACVNDPPVASDDSATTPEDNPVDIDVLVNDSDVDGDTLNVDTVTQPSNGSVIVINNGTAVTYTPDYDFCGSDSFTYTAGDGNGGTDTATVSVGVTCVNDPPVAVDDSATTPEDNPVDIDVLANDSDVDGDTLNVDGVMQPGNGSVIVINNGTAVTYTPDSDFCGSDSFGYTAGDGNGGSDTATVTLNVACVNDPPIADPNGPYLGAVGSPTAFDGTGSSDPENDSLVYTWDFGDSNNGAGPTPNHSYAIVEIYDVCLTADDGALTDTACTIAVVYDPTGGFVTGGGWIDSPAGAMTVMSAVWDQGFEANTSGWFDNNSGWYGTVTRVASNHNGIASSYGSHHAIFEGDDISGPFSRFDGYRDTWTGTWKAEIDIYLDPSWAPGTGFDYSVAANGSNNEHQRDYIFHVTKDTSTGNLLVAGSNNTNFAPREDLENINHYVVATAGWYTLQHVFYNNAGALAVDLNLLDANGDILFTETRSDASDLIPNEVGGNRYAWFTFINVVGGIATDEHQLFLRPSGKANFGFVSKYKKGATVPTGNTEFVFQAGNLNFHSTSYDWLVVTGSDYAKFKGEGTINGEGNYKFKIWAGDGDPDTFRIKIWEEDEVGNETVVYDNGVDQAIGGGNIVVHTKK